MRERSRPRYPVAAICLVLASTCVHRTAAFGTAAPLNLGVRRAASAPPRQQRHRPSLLQNVPASSGPLHSSVTSDADSSSDDAKPVESPRSYLRRVTGFSLTALRSTLRAATGFSLTAFRTTIRAATGISLSQTISGLIRRILSYCTPGMRYFLQPLLILYYAPQLVVKYWMVGPSKEYVEESLKTHERVVEGWRQAVAAAEKASDGGYWPVHVNEDGTITTALPPDPSDVLDLTDGIEKSVAAAAGTPSGEGLSP